MQDSDKLKLAYTIPEAVRALSISRTRVYNEINAGRLVARKAGGRTLITALDLSRWLEQLPTLQAATNEGVQ